MSGLSSADLRGLMKKLDLTQARLNGQITETYRELVKAIFVDIVVHTPQFTGNLAGGWEIVTTSSPAVGHETFDATARQRFAHQVYASDSLSPYKRGDNPAVDTVLARELPKLDSIRYNSKIKIVNNVDYASAVDLGEGPDGREIRPENLYYGQVFMVSYAAMKYNRMKNLIKVTKL